MNAKDKEFYDIVLKNCTEKEIYAILVEKKRDKLGARTLGARSGGSKNVTYIEHTT